MKLRKRRILKTLKHLAAVDLTSQASLWTLWTAISSSVSCPPPACLRSPPVSPLPTSLESALICDPPLLLAPSEPSSERFAIDIATDRLRNWTWRETSLQTIAVPGWFCWNMLPADRLCVCFRNERWAVRLFLDLQQCANTFLGNRLSF